MTPNIVTQEFSLTFAVKSKRWLTLKTISLHNANIPLKFASIITFMMACISKMSSFQGIVHQKQKFSHYLLSLMPLKGREKTFNSQNTAGVSQEKAVAVRAKW